MISKNTELVTDSGGDYRQRCASHYIFRNTCGKKCCDKWFFEKKKVWNYWKAWYVTILVWGILEEYT